MKKTLISAVLILCYALIAGGCGTGGDSGSSKNGLSYEYDSDADMNATTQSEFSGGGEGVTDESGGETADSAASENAENTASSSSKIKTDMLVYTCNLSIDTLDYDKSVGDFRNMLASVGGFVEKETYTDGQSNTSYYIEDSDKNKVYTATVRVPHDKYDTFLSGAGQLGDVRSKSSNVENVRQEYTDLNTTLAIYEAKEKRYIKMLSTITDDNHAVTVEKELTELQVKIANIKTRLNEIQEDVDYSTIDIQIREVTKYNEKPKKTDTFSQRLGNTIKSSWKTFLSFLETMLFLFIRVFPYALILLVILYVIHRVQKKRDRHPKPVISPSDMIQFDSSSDDAQAEQAEDTPDDTVLKEDITDDTENK